MRLVSHSSLLPTLSTAYGSGLLDRGFPRGHSGDLDLDLAYCRIWPYMRSSGAAARRRSGAPRAALRPWGPARAGADRPGIG